MRMSPMETLRDVVETTLHTSADVPVLPRLLFSAVALLAEYGALRSAGALARTWRGSTARTTGRDITSRQAISISRRRLMALTAVSGLLFLWTGLAFVSRLRGALGLTAATYSYALTRYLPRGSRAA